jgi:hypothetical protein
VAGFDLFSDHRPLAIFNLIGYGAQTLVKQVENLLMKQAIAPGFTQALTEILERVEAAREIFLEQVAPDR